MRRRALLATAVLAPVSGPLAEPATAVTVEGAWSRPGLARIGTAVAYLRLHNAGPTPLRLMGGSTPMAQRVEIHETSTEGGIARMRPRPEGVEVPPGGTVDLAPGGLHLMLIAPARDLQVGDSFPLTLHFAGGGSAEVAVAVTSRVPAPGGAGHGAR